MSELSDLLKPHVDAIERSAGHGNKRALEVIQLYQMHARQPADPGAAGLCKAAFDEWRKTSSLCTDKVNEHR